MIIQSEINHVKEDEDSGQIWSSWWEIFEKRLGLQTASKLLDIFIEVNGDSWELYWNKYIRFNRSQ